jgi:hypothetical protein
MTYDEELNEWRKTFCADIERDLLKQEAKQLRGRLSRIPTRTLLVGGIGLVILAAALLSYITLHVR